MLSDSNRRVVGIFALLYLGYIIGTNGDSVPFIVPLEMVMLLSAIVWIIDWVVRKFKKKKD